MGLKGRKRHHLGRDDMIVQRVSHFVPGFDDVVLFLVTLEFDVDFFPFGFHGFEGFLDVVLFKSSEKRLV